MRNWIGRWWNFFRKFIEPPIYKPYDEYTSATITTTVTINGETQTLEGEEAEAVAKEMKDGFDKAHEHIDKAFDAINGVAVKIRKRADKQS